MSDEERPRHISAAEIERRRKLLKKTAKAVSLEAGLGETAVGDIERGRSRSPGQDTLEAIARVLGCTSHDLMRRAHLMIQNREDEEYPVQPEPPPVADQVHIPVLDIRAASGPEGSWATVEHGIRSRAQLDPREQSLVVGTWSLPTNGFAARFGAAPERVRLMDVVGDSMEPTLLPGQIVMVDTEDRGPSPPGIFVVWDGFGLVLKRVEGIAFSDPLTVRIISDNPRYESYERLLDEAYIMGRVIGGWMRK